MGRMLQSCMRLTKANQGNTSMIFSLTLPVMLAAAGLSVDVSKWNSTEQHMQQIADVAALTAARAVFAEDRGTLSAQTVVNAVLKAHATEISDNSQITASVNEVSRTVSVAMNRPRDRYFSTLFNVGANDQVVNSRAYLPPRPPLCLLSLNPIEPGALDLSGGADVDTPACAVQVNSADAAAVVASNNSMMTAADYCIVGGISSASAGSLTPNPQVGCDSLGDPLAGQVPQIVPTRCDFNNYRTQNNHVGTLAPGVYCGGLNISSGSEVFMDEGEYFIVGGPLRFGGGKIFGRNVVFYLVDAAASITVQGNPVIHLEGRSEGILKGFVILANPGITTQVDSNLTGASVMYLEGTVYLKTHDLKFAGTVETSDSPYLAMIADTIRFTGTQDYSINANMALTKVPLPLALKAATAGSPYLVE